MGKRNGKTGNTGIDENGLIASFTVDHERLQPGIYLSRMDTDPATGSIVTTFDIRMTAPNMEPVLDTATIHAIEHLGATYLRNESNIRERVVYFGPMGCRTGFYLIVFGGYRPEDAVDTVRDMFRHIASYEGEVPGAKPAECGNWHDIDLNMARWAAVRFLERDMDAPGKPVLEYPSAG